MARSFSIRMRVTVIPVSHRQAGIALKRIEKGLDGVLPAAVQGRILHRADAGLTRTVKVMVVRNAERLRREEIVLRELADMAGIGNGHRPVNPCHASCRRCCSPCSGNAAASP